MSESALGKADSSKTPDNKELTECPTCGRDDFVSNSGMKVHHAQKHGESLVKQVTLSCDICGEEYSKPHWRVDENTTDVCSQDCFNKFQANVHKKHYTKECEICGTEFDTIPSQPKKTCSKACEKKLRSQNQKGKNNYFWRGGKDVKQCEQCGDSYRVDPNEADGSRFCTENCHHAWMSENQVGENAPNWKGGGRLYYGSDWEAKANECRKRDEFKCQDCGTDESELPKSLHVHHIIPLRQFDDVEEANKLNNLVSLCPDCHQKWEGLYLRPDTR